MPELLDFGKNSIFIWTCYGITILVLGSLVITSLRKKKMTKRALTTVLDEQNKTK
ncbi:MAG: heme exporter protein CcmD [Robiginitomaculum sp.]|nr:heme exporter protein CcmD [Robiginitomaculum sp.]